MWNRLLISGVWVLSAVTFPVEIVAGWRATGGYDWFDHTISELAMADCSTTCSPAHTWLNAALIVAGCNLVVGALSLARRLQGMRRRWPVAVVTALNGLSTLATGLVPLDQDPVLHFLVSAPALALAAVPVVLLAPITLRQRPLTLMVVQVVSVVALLAGVSASLWVDAPVPGLLERLAVWPSTLLLAAFGVWLTPTPRG